MIGRLFVGFLIVVAALGVIGICMIRRANAKKAPSEKTEEERALSEKTVNNVFDLEDRFNRARYMDQDGN